MIVPEAYLAYGVSFDEVHVFTTGNKLMTDHAQVLSNIFGSHFPEVRFSITALINLELPNTSLNQALFEEALLEWYIAHAGKNDPYVCISGGTKTMPATMQMAARYFGARDVFHIISDMPARENPTNIGEVITVIRDGKLNLISIGAESGWPYFRELAKTGSFSAVTPHDEVPGLFLQETPLQPVLSSYIRTIMERVRKAALGQEVHQPPFSLLRLLPSEVYKRLEEPLDFIKDEKWVLALPKIDLHCHLGGFATHGVLLNEVRKAAASEIFSHSLSEPPVPEGWPLPQLPIQLNDYMALGNANGSALLKDKGCLSKKVELLYNHFLTENIRYAEVRCSPDNYTSTGRNAWMVLSEIAGHFQHQMDLAFENDPGNAFHVNLLVIATRKQEGDLSSISRHLALAITAANVEPSDKPFCRVVGVDLAGYENKDTRPAYFANDFIGVHRSGLAVTAHAGENDDAESIWQAVHQLHARRIGHGLNLFQAKDQMRTMADRKIGIEMCPYANYQVKGFSPMPGRENEAYKLMEYMRQGIPVTVNTDNIGISAANLSQNFLLLSRMTPEISRMDVLQLIRNSIDTAFCNAKEKDVLAWQFDNQVFRACLECL